VRRLAFAAWKSDNLHLPRWVATLEVMIRSNPLVTEPNRLRKKSQTIA
jgi:hypothetical protein